MSITHRPVERAIDAYEDERVRYFGVKAVARDQGHCTLPRAAWYAFRNARRVLEEKLHEHGRPFVRRGKTYRLDRGGFLQTEEPT